MVRRGNADADTSAGAPGGVHPTGVHTLHSGGVLVVRVTDHPLRVPVSPVAAS